MLLLSNALRFCSFSRKVVFQSSAPKPLMQELPLSSVRGVFFFFFFYAASLIVTDRITSE